MRNAEDDLLLLWDYPIKQTNNIFQEGPTVAKQQMLHKMIIIIGNLIVLT